MASTQIIVKKSGESDTYPGKPCECGLLPAVGGTWNVVHPMKDRIIEVTIDSIVISGGRVSVTGTADAGAYDTFVA